MIPASISLVHLIKNLKHQSERLLFECTKNDKSKFMSVAVLFFILFLFITTASAISTINESKSAIKICLNSGCIEKYKVIFSGTISLLIFFASAFTTIITFLGAWLALKSYLSSATSSAISNYISHFNLFTNYVQNEVERSSTIKLNRIDIYFWYNRIFPNIKHGDATPSENYLASIKKIKETIEETSERVKSKEKDYNYNKHQKAMTDATIEIGIHLSSLPKNNFDSVESEIVKTIDSVNRTFTTFDIKLSDLDRPYARR